MPTHRAVHVPSAGAALELVDAETIPPGRDEVRLTITACGICGTDSHFVAGGFPDMTWPLTPGHEIAGKIAELGEGIEDFNIGDRVAVGWFGGCCYRCEQCRKGQFIHCRSGKVPSWHYPGGYAESATVPVSALARIPDGLTDTEAAPMGCAGTTVYNALRHTKALPGDRVAILGVGGLGHLGVQFARAMGFETIAIARGTGKEDDARKLGAHHYIDSTASDPAEALNALGGATVVLATAGSSPAMAATVGGIAPQGELVTIGVTPEPLPISPVQLITPGLSIVGHPSGTAKEVEDTMQFAVLSGVRAWIEELPLAQAAEGFAALEQGRAHYRTVLTM
ncbi:alcohol dehydrogenase catalytic domain-containing protein [Mycobacterium shigaense]|uniref:Alcohol dehydrogenase n=1 Tax=Mycobacterium shigaense TaxID=722731 RepID=A0A1Z4EIU9_9MYCO|nr:alcohol dehydrogenase catalytic domain-containing protein [Mycobacterium shigaense]MEA1123563.1 alcohol dehydrogenase catalytic domain-containing protein [Mycobacterium shigaense]PRI13700.1 alcohol dehydrogenase [Mycobacterium shigaense]BAX92820.1 alcohol dehydrogenase [Mycobacterium shigaense]